LGTFLDNREIALHGLAKVAYVNLAFKENDRTLREEALGHDPSPPKEYKAQYPGMKSLYSSLYASVELAQLSSAG
jgi:hypothetical protein